IKAFENEIIQELFTNNLLQLKEYHSSFDEIYCEDCRQEQVNMIQNHICKTYLPRMKLYFEYYEFVNNSEKAQEYLLKLEELHGCGWKIFIGLLTELIKQIEENYFYSLNQ
ncbi:38492_t:CDS:1, partial [Gigaspora margarita]